MRIFIIAVACIGIGIIAAKAQTSSLDRLKLQFYYSSDIKEKQTCALKICEQYFSLSADSLQRYVNLGLSLTDKNSSAFFRFKNFYCFYFLKLGKAAESSFYADSLLRHIGAVENNDSIRLELIGTKAVSLIRNNQYKEAVEVALQFLGGAENMKDSLSVLKAYTILGWANMETENEREAVNWLTKGLKYSTNSAILSNVSSLFNNIASCYESQRQYDSAIYYVNQGLNYSIDVENLGNQANALNIRADIYSKINKIKEAQQDLEDALIIREKIGDLPYIIADMGQLSRFYATTKQPDKGIAIALKGIELAKKSNNLYKLIYLNQGLAQNYKAAARINDYADVLKNIIILKDSLHEKNSEGAIAEMVSKYELQKKENIIIQQENKLIRNRYVNYAAVLALLLGSIIAWLLYRNYRHIQNRKMEQALAEEKIHSVKAVQQAEEKERKRIAADLHDNLGSYAAAITSNIRYLKKDGTSVNSQLIAQLDDNAQGIVTQLSDSIWVLKNEQLSITNLADRFKSWTQKIIQNYPYVKYNYKEDIRRDIELAPAKALNIFLVLKECLNNALKHSECSEISIEFICKDKLFICIEDNGIGFDPNQVQQGNGIENIKTRILQSDMDITWEGLPNQGTRVSISGSTTN